jgi:predicted nucleotidyltransferase
MTVPDPELVQRLGAAARRVLPASPVRVAYLYGSRACGRPRPDSDIDIGVLLAPDAPPYPESLIADALGEAAAVGSIEVTVLDDAPLRFLGRVLRNRIVLYSRDEPGRVEWESRIGRMSDDVEVWAAPLDRALVARVADGRR